MIEYNNVKSKYEALFIEESKRLIEVFRNEIVEIHHFGSSALRDHTLIDSLDILPVVKDLSRVLDYQEELEAIGYQLVHNNLEKERNVMFYKKIGQLKTYIILVERHDFYAIDRRLAVRDYLRAHKEERAAYTNLKVRLAKQYPNQYDMYKKVKDDYIAKLERVAIEWYKLNKQFNK